MNGCEAMKFPWAITAIWVMLESENPLLKGTKGVWVDYRHSPSEAAEETVQPRSLICPLTF